MLQDLSVRIKDLAFRLFDQEDGELLSEERKTDRVELMETVNNAKQEWLNAQSYFNNAIEPELVDHAILSLQAAERKYMYWLRRMRNLE